MPHYSAAMGWRSSSTTRSRAKAARWWSTSCPRTAADRSSAAARWTTRRAWRGDRRRRYVRSRTDSRENSGRRHDHDALSLDENGTLRDRRAGTRGSARSGLCVGLSRRVRSRRSTIRRSSSRPRAAHERSVRRRDRVQSRILHRLGRRRLRAGGHRPALHRSASGRTVCRHHRSRRHSHSVHAARRRPPAGLRTDHRSRPRADWAGMRQAISCFSR